MPVTLAKSATIQGMALTGVEGAKLGTIREIFVDLVTGQVAFLIVERSNFMSGSGKFHPLPWPLARFDPVSAAFQAQLTKDQLKASPSYDRAQLANSDYGWDRQATLYFDGLAAPPVL